jgi:hypothetical protein
MTCRARLGQKMKGIARVYDHVTPAMRRMILDVPETRLLSSLVVLTPAEQARLAGWFLTRVLCLMIFEAVGRGRCLHQFST